MTDALQTETWLRDAFDRLVLELRLFGRTFAAFALKPGESALAWQSGERYFMNPLGFGATAAGAYLAIAGVLEALWPIPGSEDSATLTNQITAAVGPYLQYALLGVAMHLGLRALGSRSRVLGSIGAAFFAGGTIGTLTALVLSATTRWIGHTRGTNSLELHAGDLAPFLIMGAGLLSYALVCTVMARALMTLHRTAAWKAVLAGAFAIVFTAFLFGTVLPQGNYGWHPYLRVARGFAINFGFRG